MSTSDDEKVLRDNLTKYADIFSYNETGIEGPNLKFFDGVTDSNAYRTSIFIAVDSYLGDLFEHGKLSKDGYTMANKSLIKLKSHNDVSKLASNGTAMLDSIRKKSDKI